MILNRLMIVFAIFLFSGCASLTTISGSCGTSPNNNICLGEESIQEGQEELFRKASTEVIDAVASKQFITELEHFYSLFSGEGDHSIAWSSINIEKVQSSLISEINGLKIETYGGISGFFYNKLFGNVAFDGSLEGPIRLNRCALPRSSASIANTISHEAAHRIGLTHPNSDDDLEVANCEPPYVIGSLIEKQIAPDKFNLKYHCHLFGSDKWKEISQRQ